MTFLRGILSPRIVALLLIGSLLTNFVLLAFVAFPPLSPLSKTEAVQVSGENDIYEHFKIRYVIHLEEKGEFKSPFSSIDGKYEFNEGILTFIGENKVKITCSFACAPNKNTIWTIDKSPSISGEPSWWISMYKRELKPSI